jgi:hypothetical protein
MSEFGDLYLKYDAIYDAINRILGEGSGAVDPDAALAKLHELHPELASKMPNLRQEIVTAARQVGVPLREDGQAQG